MVEEITDIINNSSLKHYEDEAIAYRSINRRLVDISKNKQAENIVNNSMERLILGNANITKSLGVVYNGENILLNDFYKKTLNQATFKVTRGAFSSQQVVRSIVNDLSNSGIRVINYQQSGRNYTVESASKMLVRTTLNQMTGEISLANARDMEQDLMEISAHAGARPSHAEWQGQVVSLSGDNTKYLSLDDIGYGDVGGFLGANCRHNWYPFFEGISERAWTKEMLEDIDPEPFEFEDKEYTFYEATQKQRQIERTIRKYKHRVMMHDKVGDDESKLIAQVRLQRQRQLYKDFNKAGKLRPTTVNTSVYGYNKNKYFEELKQSNRYKIYNERISGTYLDNATFASEKSLKIHLKKHLKEFDNISEEEYVQKARDLLNAELSDSIKGFMTQQKTILKYNVKNNEFVVGNPKGFISTFYKPSRGINYWKDEVKRYEIFRGNYD
ncbi:MAG: phage minor capsid protein [Anaerococcus prevotii]|nr:phage minor capsid protein [uncultured Anaerococcus sp.]MDU5149140.1 phage minor capsid protein [Anaerococcus prevotii]